MTKNQKWERERVRAFERDSYKCQECGSDGEGMWKLCIHHKIPRVEGGLDEASNLITLCSRCHCDVHQEMGSGTLGYRNMIKEKAEKERAAPERGKMHPWWNENPPKKTSTAKPKLKRGKQTIKGEHGPIGVYKSKGGK